LGILEFLEFSFFITDKSVRAWTRGIPWILPTLYSPLRVDEGETLLVDPKRAIQQNATHEVLSDWNSTRFLRHTDPEKKYLW